MLFRASMPHNSEILFCHTIPLWSHYSGAIWSRYLAASMSHNFTYTLLCNTNSIPKISCHKKVADQSRSQSLVPLDQRSENESSGSNPFEITKEITCGLHLRRMPKMVAPRALNSSLRPEGSWALGTRMVAHIRRPNL